MSVNMINNTKSVGEQAVNCVIGELAKWNIGVAFPLSDNFPFDLIAIYNNDLFKIQVKGSNYSKSVGSITFDIRSNNWYSKTYKKYYKEDCDIVICYDLKNHFLYLLGEENFSGKNSVTIRTDPTKNKQKNDINFHEDFIISKEKIEKVFVK